MEEYFMKYILFLQGREWVALRDSL